METLINLFVIKKRNLPYEYMDSWKRFDETSLSKKENVYNNVNMESITDADFKHANKV